MSDYGLDRGFFYFKNGKKVNFDCLSNSEDLLIFGDNGKSYRLTNWKNSSISELYEYFERSRGLNYTKKRSLKSFTLD